MFNCSTRAGKLITVLHKQVSLLYLNRMRSLTTKPITELCQLYVFKCTGIDALFVRVTVNTPFDVRRLLFTHPASFNLKTLHFSFTVYLFVPCNSHVKPRLFTWTDLIDWSFQRSWSAFSVRYDLRHRSQLVHDVWGKRSLIILRIVWNGKNPEGNGNDLTKKISQHLSGMAEGNHKILLLGYPVFRQRFEASSSSIWV